MGASCRCSNPSQFLPTIPRALVGRWVKLLLLTATVLSWLVPMDASRFCASSPRTDRRRRPENLLPPPSSPSARDLPERGLLETNCLNATGRTEYSQHGTRNARLATYQSKIRH